MRSAIVAAAFAAGALAVPFQKRATITDYDIVYVTEVVTVTAGAHPASAVHASSSSRHYGHSVPTSSTHAAAPASTSSTLSTRKSSTKAAVPVSTSKSSTHAVAPVSTSKTSTVGKSSTKAAAPVSTSKSSTHAVAPVSTSRASSSTHSTAAATSAQSAVPTTYEEIAVFHHNLHRSNHSAPDIAWSASLANTAAIIASNCIYQHNITVNGGGYGQNIAAGVEANNISSIITDLFYNGEEEWFANLYGQAQPDMTNFEHWGHFSQIVWKGSQSVGCATQHCPGGLQGVSADVAPYFTVCNYEAPGNYANEYAANIGSPLGRATAHWNTGL